MIGQITDFYSSGYGSARSQSNGFYAPSSVKSDIVVPPTKTSAKAIYEQRKNYARDSISNMSDTSQYHVEHLTTFVIDRKDGVLTVEDGIRKLKLMDAKGKIWTQDMILQVQDRGVNLYDVESKNELENFPVSTIQHCQAMMNTCRYNSILALVCKEPTQSKADLHLFQCDEVKASLVQQDIEYAVSDSKGGKHRKRPDALRAMQTENKFSPPPVAPAPVPPGSVTQVDVRSRVSAWSSWASEYGDYESLRLNHNLDETPEMAAARIDRDVQILNHILDDIEFFIMKLQKAAEAYTQLSKRKKYKRSYKAGPGEGVLTLRAQPPPHEEFIDCFQKFKHGMNLLAKLRSHIRNPTASELVHFLFTPLKMMVEATGGPALASTILSPLLIKDALDFLQFILNMEEKAFWASLGDTWNKSRAEWPKDQFIPPYIPRFRNGWEPPSLTFVGIPKEQQLNYVAESVGIVSELQHKHEINKLMEYSSIREYQPSEGNIYIYRR